MRTTLAAAALGAAAISAGCKCPPTHVDAALVGPSVVVAADAAAEHFLEGGAAPDSQVVLEMDDLRDVFEAAMAAGD
jgi:hypothetical protein